MSSTQEIEEKYITIISVKGPAVAGSFYVLLVPKIESECMQNDSVDLDIDLEKDIDI